MSKICITSHREISAEDRNIIFKKMSELMTDNSISEIYFGGAIGGDTVALQSCLDLAVLHSPKLVVVVPDTLLRQPKQTHAASLRAHEIIELRNPILQTDGWASFHIRDRYLVDNTDKCVAFFDGIPKGGTYQTKNYAKLNGKIVEEVEIYGRK